MIQTLGLRSLESDQYQAGSHPPHLGYISKEPSTDLNGTYHVLDCWILVEQLLDLHDVETRDRASSCAFLVGRRFGWGVSCSALDIIDDEPSFLTNQVWRGVIIILTITACNGLTCDIAYWNQRDTFGAPGESVAQVVYQSLKIVRGYSSLVQETDVMGWSCSADSALMSLKEKIECVRVSDRSIDDQSTWKVAGSIDVAVPAEESGVVPLGTDAD